MMMLIALIPALAWGSGGVVANKLGGTSGQQTFGMTVGALIFGMATMFFYVLPNGFTLDWKIWIVGFLSGLFWAVGTAGQFGAMQDIGVSLAVPLSTAGQITTNALMAAVVLGDWHTGKMWLFGVIAIVLVLTGALLISAKAKSDKNQTESTANSAAFRRGMISIVISTAGYMMYFVFPNLMSKFGFITEAVKLGKDGTGVSYMTAIVGPQSVGQVLGALLIVIFVLKQKDIMFEMPTWKNIVTGLIWALGNVAMFIAAGNPAIGQATAATLSQMGIVVGTFGGIYILHEHKTSDQMVKIIIGSILVVVGGILVGNLANL